MAKKPTPLEVRREAEAVIAGVDLARAKRLQEIFSGEAFASALEALREIHDDGPGAPQTGAATNVNALIAHGITFLTRIPEQAAEHVKAAELVLNPPEAVADPAMAAAAASAAMRAGALDTPGT